LFLKIALDYLRIYIEEVGYIFGCAEGFEYICYESLAEGGRSQYGSL
jgi:hypothetical protein